MASREEVERFINALKDDESLRKEVERAILDARLLAVPGQLGDLVKAVNALTAVTAAHTGRLDRIDGRLDRIDGRLDRIGDDVGQVKGNQLENDLKAHPRLALRGLGPEVRHLRALADDEIIDLEVELGLSETEAIRLSKTDLVAVVADLSGSPVGYVAVEASWRTGSEDVTHVVASASILARTGLPVRAVVYDEAGVAHPHVAEEIRDQGVTHLSSAA